MMTEEPTSTAFQFNIVDSDEENEDCYTKCLSVIDKQLKSLVPVAKEPPYVTESASEAEQVSDCEEIIMYHRTSQKSDQDFKEFIEMEQMIMRQTAQTPIEELEKELLIEKEEPA
ncbi:hypothetical protein PCE1_002964 [Barthelona sp. PCE]